MSPLLRTGFAFRGAGVRPRLALSALLGAAFLAAGCSDAPTNNNPDAPPVEGGLDCSIPLGLIQDGGVGLDGIPALTDPAVTGVWDPATEFLLADDRVISLELDGQMIAIPHRVLWWHEIINLNRGDERVAVTCCPLTGSSMVYDRSGVAGAEFGVSGLLFQNNLIMYDRGPDGGSLWPQMMRQAGCGERDGQALAMVPAVEIKWARWRELYPDGEVVVAPSNAIGTTYDQYPYGDYEELNNSQLLYPQQLVDFRRPVKERVFGIPDGTDRGKAYPFGEMNDAGPAVAINDEVGGAPVLVLWDSNGHGGLRVSPDGERAGPHDLPRGRQVRRRPDRIGVGLGWPGLRRRFGGDEHGAHRRRLRVVLVRVEDVPAADGAVGDQLTS